MPLPSSDLTGRTLADKYVLFERIGAGGMGVVYKASRLSDGEVVAVKVMHVHLAADPRLVRRFKREARAATAVDHPGSVRILDGGQSRDGLLYIVMELLDGRDLGCILHEERPMSQARAVDRIIQVLCVVARAHALGIVHRDLKPENIVVVTDRFGGERLTVCDFGLAKILEPRDGAPRSGQVTLGGVMLGTPEYMSPEQARGEEMDARTDIYSIGVILYEMITGRLPFEAESSVSVALMHALCDVTPPRAIAPHVDLALDAICMRALAKRPDDRFANADEMLYALAAVRSRLRDRVSRPQGLALERAALERASSRPQGSARPTRPEARPWHVVLRTSAPPPG